MNLTFYGAGYVGLVSAACLAKLGHTVMCIDINEEKIRSLNQGKITIFEPRLETLVKEMCRQKRLIFSTDITEGVAHGKAQFITVQTPTLSSGESDLSFIQQVCQSIATLMQEYRCIINKSTAPVGTVDLIQQTIQSELIAQNKKIDFDAASNPEFLREGQAVNDFLNPDRIILGCQNSRARAVLAEIYQSFPSDKSLYMDIRSAELTKYAANAFLAAKISFINEIANYADKVNADVEPIRAALGLDPRIGPHFIAPGCGYGGSCFPKDVKALTYMLQKENLSGALLNSVNLINQSQKTILFDKFQQILPKCDVKKVALWGLSFKPETDDIREASSLAMLEILWANGFTVQAYDPAAMPSIAKYAGDRKDLILCATKEACLENAAVLFVITEWEEFKNADLAVIKNALKYPIIFDGRNCINKTLAKQLGLTYVGIGTR